KYFFYDHWRKDCSTTHSGCPTTGEGALSFAAVASGHHLSDHFDPGSRRLYLVLQHDELELSQAGTHTVHRFGQLSGFLPGFRYADHCREQPGVFVLRRHPVADTGPDAGTAADARIPGARHCAHPADHALPDHAHRIRRDVEEHAFQPVFRAVQFVPGAAWRPTHRLDQPVSDGVHRDHRDLGVDALHDADPAGRLAIA